VTINHPLSHCLTVPTQAGKLVAQMSSEQVKLQQAVVKEAVEKEAATNSLNKEEATELLKTTLLVTLAEGIWQN
jgi:hypothetical protein